MGSIDEARVMVSTSNQIQYHLYGDEIVAALGVVKVVLEATGPFEAKVGEIATFKVVAVHREQVER
jgi:hypothetical protein